jgi:hypothetical protein
VTGADFTGVDIDLLADYVGGALAGTPDEARVAALIVDDPAWRDAHALLSDGVAAVCDSLREWGAEPEPMPAAVAARLESAFAEIGGAAPARGPHLVAVRETGVDREKSQRVRARRRTLRWGASLAAAAAVLAFAGIGISYLGSSTSSSDTATSSAAGEAKAAPQAQADVPLAAVISDSGIDYGPGTIANGPLKQFSASDAGGGPPHASRQASPSSPGAMSAEGLEDGLARLRPRPALQACLDAIGAENGAGPITVQTVDYARFTGKPALVVHFTAGNGAWAWASGPDCGLSGVGASTRISVKVG